MIAEGRLDLADLDPVTADLDLSVDPTAELQTPVRAPPRQVSGAVEPSPEPLRERIRDELLRRELGLIDVTERHAEPADHELTLLPRRHLAELLVDHVTGRVLNRPADGQRRLRVGNLADRVDGSEESRLGGAIAVDDLVGQAAREEASDVIGRENVATHEDVAEACELLRVTVHHHVELRRDEQGRCGPLVMDRLGEPLETLVSGWHDDRGASGQQGAPELDDRRVEGQRRKPEESAIRPELDVFGSTGDEPVDGPVRDSHTLRGSGAAAGVDDVGGIAWIALGKGARVSCVWCLLRADRGPTDLVGEDGVLLVAHDQPESAVLRDEPQPVGRPAGLERHVRTTRPQDAAEPGDDRRRRRPADSDSIPRLCPGCLKAGLRSLQPTRAGARS